MHPPAPPGPSLPAPPQRAGRVPVVVHGARRAAGAAPFWAGFRWEGSLEGNRRQKKGRSKKRPGGQASVFDRLLPTWQWSFSTVVCWRIDKIKVDSMRDVLVVCLWNGVQRSFVESLADYCGPWLRGWKGTELGWFQNMIHLPVCWVVRHECVCYDYGRKMI